jgi:hypothetical protein
MRRMIFGHSGMNHLNKALFEVLPTRNHTITGLIAVIQTTLREVLILRYDSGFLLNRVIPNFGVVCLAKSDLPYGVSITTNLT